MRIIEPSRKRKSGFKTKSSQSSDLENKSDDFGYADKKSTSKAKKTHTTAELNAAKELYSQAQGSKSKKQESKNQESQGRGSKGEGSAEPKQFSDGRKRRRSEYGQVSFFNSQASNKEAAKSDVNDIKAGEGKTLEDFADLFTPPDETQKEFNRLLSSGIRLLGMREHSVKEITDKLLAKTEFSDVAYAVIDDLLENKYLSNERFTESYIRSRMNRGFGPVKIKSELMNKGVSDNLVDEHLDQGAAVWFDNAKSEHKKKYGDAPIADYSAWTKRARFLQSRGFNMDQIHSAITAPDNT